MSVKKLKGRPADSTNPDSRELPETEPQIRGIHILL